MSRIAVFGLGYVGVVTAAVLAEHGHHVVGVDPNFVKVDLVNRGESPIVEAGLDELVGRGVRQRRLSATTDPADAVRASTISMVCVGTPSQPNGSLDLSAVEKVCHQIGATLAGLDDGHVVVLRSTMLPGSTRAIAVPALEEASGRRAGDGFHVCVNPEFLREGTAIRDFAKPPFTLVGTDDAGAADAVSRLYEGVSAERIVTSPEVAEMIKYGSNAFHALKVTFANEVGSICKQQGVDSHRVMEILCRDTQLNISPAYLTPGFAFGGSCLPKDLRALLYHARRADLEVPLLASILESNRRHIDRAFELVQRTGRKRIGLLGLSFKAGTDDLRESPSVELIERLIGKGYDVRIFDRNVSIARIQGANRQFIEREIPHISALMTEELSELLDASEVIVIGNGDREFAHALQGANNGQHTVIDLVRLDGADTDSECYQGICW
jgi:GDP-mannose 6-dehydrogenase